MKNKTGIQITSQRVGELEKELFKYVLNLPKSALGIDLGGGDGFISMALSLIHKKIYFYDLKINLKLKIFKKLFSQKRLILKKHDLKKIKKSAIPKKIDFIYSARFLHYLAYEEAENLLRKFSINTKTGGKIFLTLSGLESAIGEKYPCAKKQILERYCFLEQKWRERFEIREKITLYNKKELISLVEKYFEIEKVWESDFKNIFLIGIKR